MNCDSGRSFHPIAGAPNRIHLRLCRQQEPGHHLPPQEDGGSGASQSVDLLVAPLSKVLQMKHRWKLDTAKMDLLPDGSAHGGAPSANNLAVARNLAPLGASALSVAGRGTWWPNLQQVGRGMALEPLFRAGIM